MKIKMEMKTETNLIEEEKEAEKKEVEEEGEERRGTMTKRILTM